MWWINVVTNVKSKEGIFPPKYFTIFYGFMAIANTLFYIYDRRMFVTNNNTIKIYILYFWRTKAVISVNSSDGFSLVIVNNTLFHIYDGRMFVANNNTIKKIFFLYFRYTKAVTSVSNYDGFYSVIVNNTSLAMNIFIPS